ncbi:MAG: hypothetical protein NTV08_08130 [Verrucomicrobia bacterium]|nr:hypothetical protein [Verrucomicrobiota bacterium]
MSSVLRSLLLAVSLFAFSACNDGAVQRERAAREAAERAAKEAQQGKSTWQTVAFVVGIGAVTLLVFGTALGSSARKHAQKQKDQKDNQPR